MTTSHKEKYTILQVFSNIAEQPRHYRSAFTRQRSLVRTQHRPLEKEVYLQVKSVNKIGMLNSQWALITRLSSISSVYSSKRHSRGKHHYSSAYPLPHTVKRHLPHTTKPTTGDRSTTCSPRWTYRPRSWTCTESYGSESGPARGPPPCTFPSILRAHDRRDSLAAVPSARSSPLTEPAGAGRAG